jgi:hypothetical protein
VLHALDVRTARMIAASLSEVIIGVLRLGAARSSCVLPLSNWRACSAGTMRWWQPARSRSELMRKLNHCPLTSMDEAGAVKDCAEVEHSTQRLLLDCTTLPTARSESTVRFKILPAGAAEQPEA